ELAEYHIYIVPLGRGDRGGSRPALASPRFLPGRVLPGGSRSVAARAKSAVLLPMGRCPVAPGIDDRSRVPARRARPGRGRILAGSRGVSRGGGVFGLFPPRPRAPLGFSAPPFFSRGFRAAAALGGRPRRRRGRGGV